MKKKEILSYFVFIACFGLIALNAYWQYWPYKIRKVYQPLPILNEDHTLRGGDTIRWRAHYQMLMGGIKVDSIFYLEPVDKISACEFKILQEVSSVTVVGEIDHINATTVVPKEFKPCMYHVRIQSNFHVNPIRIIALDTFTEDFNVVK